MFDRTEISSEMVMELPEDIRLELDEFEANVEKYLANQIGEIKFQKIRLQLGCYAQRQPGYQMQRIKIPCGQLTLDKLRALADISDKYASNFLHLTTRQDVQLYYLKLKNIPNMLRALAAHGITTREACGNTVRNITACYKAGTTPDEAFDITPYALALYEYLLRNKYNQIMGRKFKIAFEGCHEDHAGLLIHDIGFQAKIMQSNGQSKRGFRVYLGGGLGGMPRLGHLYEEFLPEEEMLPMTAAVLRVFDRFGERKSRMRARMKFLIERLGFGEFRKLVDEERKIIDFDVQEHHAFLSKVEKFISRPESRLVSSGLFNLDDLDYKIWHRDSVNEHKVKGFRSVVIRIPMGDLTSNTARALADVLERFTVEDVRIMLDQNILVRSVSESSVPALYSALKEIGLAQIGALTIRDTTACPGADTCRLGITSAKGAGDAISLALDHELKEYKDLAKDVRIKISGCPNSCAQHHMGQIGFHGASYNHDNHAVPAHNVYVGGVMKGDQTRVGEFVAKIAAKNVVRVVEILLEAYKTEKNGNENFESCMERLGLDKVKTLLEPISLSHIPSYQEDASYYRDWGDQEDFDVMKGVKGECAGATVEEKVPVMMNAEKSLQQARALCLHGDYESAVLQAYQTMGLAAHVPLYQKLVDPFTAEQSIWEFENLFVRTGTANSKWLDISEKIERMRKEPCTEVLANDFLKLAEDFLNECKFVSIKV